MTNPQEGKVKRFRKKPVVVEAMHCNEHNSPHEGVINDPVADYEFATDALREGG